MSVVWNVDIIQQVEVFTGECCVERGQCTTDGGVHM